MGSNRGFERVLTRGGTRGGTKDCTLVDSRGGNSSVYRVVLWNP